MVITKRAISGAELVASGAAPGTDLNINAASGSWYADIGDDRPGEIIGVIIRVTTLKASGAAAAGTLDTLRVKIVSKNGNTAVTAATVKAEHLCYDSASIATPTPSTTDAAQTDGFGGGRGDPQPYSGGFRVLVDWTASGGTYDRVVKVAVLYRQVV